LIKKKIMSFINPALHTVIIPYKSLQCHGTIIYSATAYDSSWLSMNFFSHRRIIFFLHDVFIMKFSFQKPKIFAEIK